jgi:hypothetical protein
MLGRYFKIFEYLSAANKSMARSEAVQDIELATGLKITGMIAALSTAKRRGLNRRRQKMMSLMYMARISPYGYNLAEKDGTFPGNDELKAALLSDDPPSLGTWKTLLDTKDENGDVIPIAFFDGSKTDLNALANDMATKAVHCGINPSIVFATRHGGVDSEMWFNFQILFEGGSVYQDSMMKLMHYLNPTLCPDGLDDTRDGTLFNRNLQVLRPVRHTMKNGKVFVGQEWVDIFGGFHFLDEHYSGYSGSGTTVSTNSLPTLNTLGLGGQELNENDLERYLTHGDIGLVNRNQNGNWLLSELAHDEDDGS